MINVNEIVQNVMGPILSAGWEKLTYVHIFVVEWIQEVMSFLNF